MNIQKIKRGDKEYPEILEQIQNPPKALYCAGDVSLLKSECLAIVGTRDPSSYGVRAVTMFARDLSAAGFCIVSGMARGTDSVAHKTALDAQGKTIAVLGCGLNHVYPPENKALFERIEKEGLLVSEFDPDQTSTPYNFPIRNRIISGLSRGVLITEGGIKSGTLNTASHALAQGRELFVVPGQIFSRQSGGTNNLIKEMGGALVTDANDILTRFGINSIAKAPKSVSYTFDEQKVIDILEREPEAHFELIEAALNIGVQNTLTLLSTMELKGIITKLDGNNYTLE